ncbi:hypothetical protein GAYE_HTGSCF06PCTG21G0277 [Galdieria yellowstonensis]|uniref:Uncharacterized protein n=1 Tax=Galdieria yellowstonensis TaxID=3028027 RepID=A0AAV9I374_9RHOD|nr:hypothetical protein GAYE_HTGSCF06PCTG21G0277 [Galdieria yellowstonensis]
MLNPVSGKRTGTFFKGLGFRESKTDHKLLSTQMFSAFKLFSIALGILYFFLSGISTNTSQNVVDIVKWNLASLYHSKDYASFSKFEVSEETETRSYCLSHVENPEIFETKEPPTKVDIYIGLLLHSNEKSLVDSWIAETTKLLESLTQKGESVFLSIIEDGCEKSVKDQLRQFSRKLKELNFAFHIVLAEKFLGYPHRIYTLSRIRNCVLRPLILHEMSATRVLIFNDVTYQFERVLDLIEDRAHYDMKCGIDYFINNEKSLQLYDLWVMRDMNGDIPRAKYPFFNSYDNDRFVRRLPFRGYCCWGGIALLNGSLFQDGIRFRGLPKRPSSGYQSPAECPQSEINYLCNDIWEMREKANIYVYSSLFSVYRPEDLVPVSKHLNRLQTQKAEDITGISSPQHRPKSIVCCPWIEGVTNVSGATTLCFSNDPIYKLPEGPVRSR